MSQRMRTTGRAPRRRGRQGRSLRVLIALIAVLALSGVILRGKVFVVKAMEVIGNERYSPQEIASLCGIAYGESMLDVDEEEVQRSLATVADLEFLAMEKRWPSTVSIQVRERHPVGCVLAGGAYQVVDETGYVLSRSDTYPTGINLLLISGLGGYVDRQSRCITADQPMKLTVMKSVIRALRELSLVESVSELNLKDLDNIYLVSRTGVMVILGDSENLPDKLVWMQACLQQLTGQGISRGVLDVSTGKNAVYADR